MVEARNIRTGRHGDCDSCARVNPATGRGVVETPDLTGILSSRKLRALIANVRATGSLASVSRSPAQPWVFGARIDAGDLAALPLTRAPRMTLGIVKGGYQARPGKPRSSQGTRCGSAGGALMFLAPSSAGRVGNGHLRTG